MSKRTVTVELVNFFSRIELPVSVSKNIRPNESILTGRIDTKVKTIFYILEAKV